ncbi:CopG family transcriptional regulator, partial [Mycobacterium tuberculosis]
MLVAYICHVKRLQIYIDEDVDRALAVEARRRRTSKAALIRAYVAEHLRPPGPDTVEACVGVFVGESGFVA